MVLVLLLFLLFVAVATLYRSVIRWLVDSLICGRTGVKCVNTVFIYCMLTQLMLHICPIPFWLFLIHSMRPSFNPIPHITMIYIRFHCCLYGTFICLFIYFPNKYVFYALHCVFFVYNVLACIICIFPAFAILFCCCVSFNTAPSLCCIREYIEIIQTQFEQHAKSVGTYYTYILI